MGNWNNRTVSAALEEKVQKCWDHINKREVDLSCDAQGHKLDWDTGICWWCNEQVLDFNKAKDALRR